MYEMEGALLGPRHLIRQLPSSPGFDGPLSGPSTRVRDRFPGSSRVSGVSPWVVPVSDGESISTPRPSAGASVRGQ